MKILVCPACEQVCSLDADCVDPQARCAECGEQLLRTPAPPTQLQPAPFLTCVMPAPASDPPESDYPSAIEEPPIALVEEPEDSSDFWEALATRFVPLPYRPDGGINFARLLLLPLVVGLAALFLGWALSVIGRVWYVVLLSPLALGAGVAAAGVLAVRLARLRHGLLAGGIGLAGALAGLAFMHWLDYQRTLWHVRHDPQMVPALLREELAQDASFQGYFLAQARLGLTVSGRTAAGFNLGFWGTWIYWGLEFMLAGVVAFLGVRSAAGEPFCSFCGHWKEERPLGTLSASPEEVLATLRRGQLVQLLELPDNFQAAPLALRVCYCPCCGLESPVDVSVERILGEDGPDRQSKELLQLTYPGEALTVLDVVFQERSRRAA